jgi:hypothetical protein
MQTNDRLEVFTASGTRFPGWPYTFDDDHGGALRGNQFTHFAAFDINNDGKKEIIGLACKTENKQTFPSQSTLYVWNSNGTVASGYPIELTDTYTPITINGVSPVMVDIDNDGAIEIGLFVREGNWLYNDGAFTYINLDGTTVPGWPVAFQNQVLAPNVSLGDINGDGDIETVFGTSNNHSTPVTVHAFRRDGTPLPNWPVQIAGSVLSQVVIADVNGDGYSDVIAGTSDGEVYAWNYSGTVIPGFPKYTQIPGLSANCVHSCPAVGDVDGDGKLELAATTLYGDVFVWDLTAGTAQPALQWPMSLHDPRQSMDIRGVNGVQYLSLPGRIQAEDYRRGGEGVGYHDLSAGNTGTQYRTDNVDIEASTDVGGGYDVGWTDAAEWLAYDVNVTTAGKYTLTARMASGNAGTKTMSVTLDGVAVGTFSTTDASGWQSWKDVVVSNVNLTSGNHVLRMSMTTGGFNLNYLDVTAQTNQPPVANAGADQSAAVNTKVTLDGRASSDPDNAPSALSHSWSQVSGATVSLTGATTSQPSFTPIATGTYTFRLTVSDGAASATDEVTVNVTGSGISLPGRIQAEDYKAGGEGVGYHDLTAGNTGAQYRTDNVDIEATTDAGGGYNVGWTDAAEWLAYDVNVTAAGKYTLTARVASGNAGTKTLTVTVDGATVATFNFTDASGWQSWKDVVVSNVNLSAGTHTLRMTMTTGGFNLNYLNVATQTNQPPVANAGADQSVAVNTKVTLDGRASSDPDNAPSALSYAWSQVSGTTVSLTGATTSQPSFTPTATGTYTFRLTVSDGAASATDEVTISVSGSGISLPGRIQAEDYKAGGEGAGYHDLTSGNAGSAYKTDNVDIEATSDVGGGYNVGWTDAGEWLAYDVNVTAAGTYTLTARIASGNAGTKTLTVSLDGAAVATFNTTDASGWQSWKDVVISNVSLTAGSHVLRMTMTTGGINLNYLNVASQSNQPPVANAGADQSVAVNTKVTLDGRASGDPDNGPSALSYSWSQLSGTTVSLTGATTSQPSFTPSATGTYTFRLTVHDGAASSSDDVAITVTGSGISLPGRIQAEDYKAGGEGVGYHDLSAGNAGGQYRTDNVDIEATSDVGGGYNVGYVDAGEWLAYDVNVTQSKTYTLTARLASANAGTKTLTVLVDGASVATLNFTDASGWQSWKDVTVSNISLTAGVHSLRLAMTTGGFNVNYLNVQ